MIMPPKWRLIDSKIGSAHWNMALDEALLNDFKEGDLPILRLYGWESSLSLGKFSKIGPCVYKKILEDTKLPIVRRISGGGVLVHGGDLSYSLIIPRDWLREHGVKESYRYLCKFLINLYQKLGYKADFAGEDKLNGIRSDICLAGTEAYDILIDGNKIGGNAQRHTRHVVLQHGSIPMNIDTAFFKPFFVKDPEFDNAATLERLGTHISYEELSSHVRESFCESYGVQLRSDSISGSEEQCAKELLEDKYTQNWWNYND